MKIVVIMPVLVRHGWQAIMTECALKTLYSTTSMPFDLVLLETGARGQWSIESQSGFRYEHVPDRTTPTLDCNRALDIAEREMAATHVVYTGNDIFTRPGWLEALIKPWELYHDTGCSTVWSAELCRDPSPQIVEGVYGPFMMFEAHHRYDEAFPSQFADTDLVMRLYAEGKRSYRNQEVVIHHLLRQSVDPVANQQDFEQARQRFIEKHAGSPLLMYQILAGGRVV